MKNQVDALRNFSEEDHVAHFMNSSLGKKEINLVREDVKSGRTKLLLCGAGVSCKMGEPPSFSAQ